MKVVDYCQLQRELAALIADDDDLVSVLANTAALLNQHLEDINWVGFYLIKNDCLVLGPFQGKIACNRIPIGKGVCGTAVAERKIQRVADVHQYVGHIACDSASNSEIVLPLWRDQQIIGVLDIDSPKFARFSLDDEIGLNACLEILTQHLQQNS
ncbi:hypothetical protein CEP48_05970 [Mergibacter septicus]|uniref:GAF domain-containing protein n=1 Tax=Mergibacter septicus TaxID=221402 RepID=A0A8E3MHQ0_9PAST|nr:GAF domain-containing protein [Mergibacter septicus]AWX15746.1 hypothetical protein CEP47_05970 [Mergibacter septicus]QDJ14999.1 hypothetical protein CEP48_05970 [Mergibacter septicus]WMR95243.1 GAF domain-containing protein [Mergibacter septicus]